MKQFSLRDLLFFIVIVALGLGWWLDKRPDVARFTMGGGNSHAYVLDTATGQVWEKSYTPGNETRELPLNETPGYFQPKVTTK
jgi:hypothetical protein